MKIIVNEMPKLGEDCPFFMDGSCTISSSSDTPYKVHCSRFLCDGTLYRDDCPWFTTNTAHWIEHPYFNFDGGYSGANYECSNCHFSDNYEEDAKYCQGCGAHMVTPKDVATNNGGTENE